MKKDKLAEFFKLEVIRGWPRSRSINNKKCQLVKSVCKEYFFLFDSKQNYTTLLK